MQRSLSLLFSVVGFGLLLTGCAGPEQKFGRGLANVTEIVRLGELSRSMEQTAIYNGPEVAYTTGFVHGFNRTIGRTLTGAFEVVTAPIPPYDEPLFLPVDPVYPMSYRPGIMEDSIFATDVSMGFSGGDIAPFIPGSRFRIFENP
jgi:putative exosortase-associated protein (TIGR04073 family)